MNSFKAPSFATMLAAGLTAALLACPLFQGGPVVAQTPPVQSGVADNSSYLDELQEVMDFSGRQSNFTFDESLDINNPFLQKLVLRSARLTPASNGLSLLRTPRLVWLDLDETITDNTAVDNINKLSSLQVLVLSRTKISNAGLGRIELPHLKRLVLAETAIGDTGLARLKSHGLLWLDLRSTEVTTKGVVHLKKQTALQVLILRKTKISAAGLALLQFPLLKRLDLTDSLTDDRSIRNMQLPAIERLFLRRTAITDEGLAACNQFSTLQSLDLSQTKVGDLGLAQLNLPALRRIDLSGTKVTDAGVAKFKSRHPGVEVLR